ncbi:MAG: DUF6036 family nucleotidyltransferase [Leucobacter sp.]
MAALDSGRIRELLHKVDAACAERGIVADVFLVGGGAMALAYDSDRRTRDLDGIFAPTDELRSIIADIGESENLEPDWFNDGAKGYIIREDSDAEEIIHTKHLRVRVASPEYLLAMKLLSARETDVDDTLKLAKLSGKRSSQELLDVLTSHYPASMLQVKNRYFVEEIAEVLAQPTDHSSAPIWDQRRSLVDPFDRPWQHGSPDPGPSSGPQDLGPSY